MTQSRHMSCVYQERKPELCSQLTSPRPLEQHRWFFSETRCSEWHGIPSVRPAVCKSGLRCSELWNVPNIVIMATTCISAFRQKGHGRPTLLSRPAERTDPWGLNSCRQVWQQKPSCPIKLDLITIFFFFTLSSHNSNSFVFVNICSVAWNKTTVRGSTGCWQEVYSC